MISLLRAGLRVRLIVLVIVAASPALVALLYGVVTQYRQATADAELTAQNYVDAIAASTDAAVRDAHALLALLAPNPALAGDDPERCRAALRDMYSHGAIATESIRVVSLSDGQGLVYCSSLPIPQSYIVSDRDYFRGALETGSFRLGTPIIGRASGQPIVPAAYPVRDADGQGAGMVIAGLDLGAAIEALPDLPEDSAVMLFGGDGLVVARYPADGEWAGRNILGSPLAEAARSDTDMFTVVGVDGLERLYALRRLAIGDFPLYAAVGFATRTVYAVPQNALMVGIAAALSAALATLLLGDALGRRLVLRSLKNLSRAAARLAAGDFSVRVAVPSSDELGSVGASFNAMAEALSLRELELRDSEQRYRQVVDLVQAAIWVQSEGRVVFANDYAVRMFGAATPDGLVGREVVSLIHPDDRPRAQELARILSEQDAVLPLAELRFQRLNLEIILVEVQAVRFRRDGKVYVLASGRDITAQRSAEEQLRQSQKMEIIGRLTGGVAHDFNNLLTVIIGNLDSASPDVPQPARRMIDNALQAAERAALLTQRLLAFSRRQPLQPETLDVSALVADLDDMLRRTLGEDIEIALKLEPGLWPALADRSQVEAALLNLVVNARDAMPEGGKLTIEASRSHLDEAYARASSEISVGDYVMIAVTDTGIGMPPDVVARAVEPFFTTKEAGKGTGLGLSMVFGFAKQSRGHFRLYSELGHGTTVRLYLPRAEGGEQPVAATGADAPPVSFGKETVLVVEDDAGVRALVTSQLDSLGYNVVEAADGAAAWKILQSDQQIDLLFTDVVMPGGMTGRKLAEKAGKLRPALRCLFTSGYTENSIVHQDRLDPGVNLLSKPYRKAELARKVRETLDAPPPVAPN